MDEKYLEFWGNLLLNAAKGKKQSDDLMRWMRMGLPGIATPPSSKKTPAGFEEMIATFQKLYGLDKISEKKEDPQEIWAETLKEFQKSFQDYLTFSGVVSKKEHLALVEKYEKLKATCSIDQEETIRHLRMLLEERKEEQSDTVNQLQDIVKSQEDLFQKMMTDFSQYSSSEEPTSKTLTKTEKEEEDDQPDRPDPDV